MSRSLTMEIPLGPPGATKPNEFRSVTGDVIGPFLVHRSPDSFRRAWTVTHIATGYAAQQNVPSKKRAAWLAKKLSEFDVFDFKDPQAAKQIPKDVMSQIKILRADAFYGDMQGTQP